MYRMNIADEQQAALAFLRSQATYLEQQVVPILYPDIQYPALIPVDTSAPEWVKSITYISTDQVGVAQWFNHLAKDVPIADVVREQHETQVEMAAIGYRYTLQELGYAMLVPGTNLPTDRAAAARRAYEEFVDDVALRGNVARGWYGLINSPGITIINLPADGGDAGSPAFSSKTADQVLRDINNVLTAVYAESLTIEQADTLLVPVQVYSDLTTRRIPDTQIPIIQYLSQYNAYTAVTGQPLTIRAVRGLETAGVGNTGRIVAYRRDPQVLKMHIPMTHRFLPVWQTGPMVFDIPGIFRLGGLEFRRPGAVRYVDGVMDAPYE